ncbi:MAG: hypothetical protein AAGD25_26250 [Cyanobacteria bacterium P01_F01_bin.150]
MHRGEIAEMGKRSPPSLAGRTIAQWKNSRSGKAIAPVGFERSDRLTNILEVKEVRSPSLMLGGAIAILP